MKPGNAIEVKDLKITYKCRKALSLKGSLLHFRKSKMEVVEALKGVSFEVKKGEILGIVGKNGSGKSTLLKAIAGIFSPDSGTIDLETESVSLLSIGVGFQKHERPGKYYLVRDAAGLYGTAGAGKDGRDYRVCGTGEIH